MPVTVYSSADAGGPGPLANTAGALIAILDACLVNGYSGKTAAGWTKPFSTSTTLAAYKQGAGGKNRYVRVDDTSAAVARLVGYEDMTGISTGVNPFPTAAQVSGGLYVHKHDGDSGTRPWFLIADSRAFYFWTRFDNTIDGSSAGLTFFGETKSFKAGDDYAAFLMAADGPIKNHSSVGSAYDNVGAVSALDFSIRGHYIARSYTGIGGSLNVGKRADSFRMFRSAGYSLYSLGLAWLSSFFTTPYPSPVDAGLYVAPVVVHEPTDMVDRGFMPGLWAVCHASTVLAPGDTFSANAGPHAGKSFVALPVFGGLFAVETSNTWWSA